MDGKLNNKKILPFKILQILQERTDEEHPLTQKEIVEILDGQDISCDRRTVKASVELLQEVGYDILYENGYYMASREFENAELKMLIDSVLFSKILTKNQAERLLEKIKNLGNVYFRKSVPEVKMLSGMGWAENPQFMHSVAKLNEAIHQKKKVAFSYLKYDENLQLRETGYKYLVNPYYLLAANGFYFLLGNYDKYDNISYYRIDKIKNVEILDETAKPKKDVKNLMEIWDLPKHLAEHAYMFSGETVTAEIKTFKNLISDFVDWFGKDIQIKKLENEEITITIRSNENALFYWLLQYGMYVEVLRPQSLREKMKEAVFDLQKKYC